VKHDVLTNLERMLAGRGLRFAEGLCVSHGPFRAMTSGDKPAQCPLCAEAKDREASRARQMSLRVEAIRRGMGVPARFAGKGFRDWIADTAAKVAVRDAVAEYMRSIRMTPSQWRPLILTGLPGTGKTHLVCGLVANLAESGVSSRYTTLQTMLSDIKSAYSDNTLTEAGQILRFVKVDVLVIDEADIGRWSENDKQLVFAVINGRYNDMRPTVIVSNQAPEGLAEILTDRVISRLSEGALTLRCDWQDGRIAA